MPKGKAKKDNPDLYQDFPESHEPSMAPQAVAHRRGGKHRVKSLDLTNSIYDDFSYAEVLQLAKERNIYRKDMKKKEMAMANKHFDADEQSRQREAATEQTKREHERRRIQQQKDDEKQAAVRAKYLRAMEKDRLRAEGEEVSDESFDEDDIDAEHKRLIDGDEYKQENVGQLPSDDSWDSTSMESSTLSATSQIEPDCRLRLYEWPEWPQEKRMSLADPRGLSDSDSASDSELDECRPVKVPFAPIKVITTETKQKLFLPGQTYPPGVQPDFVPILSQRTRSAARNGVLLGVLRKATIERASDWAERTQIQSATAAMFLSLPPRNEVKNLADTYTKWCLENRKLLRVKARGDGASANRAKRHSQRFRNKAKKVVEIYEASQCRPLAVCYIPSYLDYDKRQHGRIVDRNDGFRRLDNLFYIRFPGCDLPHYYFWAKEWRDPKVQNPGWDATKVQQHLPTLSDCINVSSESKSSDVCHVRSRSRKMPKASPTKSWVRRKVPDAALPCPPAWNGLFETAVFTVEHQIYSIGLAATLSYYRKKWIADGKRRAWQEFSRLLPSLYPSGNLPNIPPSISAADEHSLAFKIASIDTLDRNELTPLNPFQGDEAWTQDDDVYWEIVQIVNSEDDIQAQLERRYETDVEPDALCRRASVATNRQPGAKLYKHGDSFLTWLSQVELTYGPWPIPKIPSMPGFDEWEREYPAHLWGKKDIRPVDEQAETHCLFCTLRWVRMNAAQRAEHMWSHSAGRNGFVAPNLLPTKPRAITMKKRILPKLGSDRLNPIHKHDEFDKTAGGNLDTPIAEERYIDSFLYRRRSGATYSPTPSDSKPRKRRKIADPTYRNTRVSDDEDESARLSLEMPAKKRRKIADTTYRDNVKASSESDEVVVNKTAKKKRRPDMKAASQNSGKRMEQQSYEDAYAAASTALRMEMKRSIELDSAEEKTKGSAHKRSKSSCCAEEHAENSRRCTVM